MNSILNPKSYNEVTAEYFSKILNFGKIKEIKEKKTEAQGYSSESKIFGIKKNY
jgi:hypothetical protein